MTESFVQYNPVYPDAINPMPFISDTPTDARPNAEDYAAAAAAREVRLRAEQLALELGMLSAESTVASPQD